MRGYNFPSYRFQIMHQASWNPEKFQLKNICLTWERMFYESNESMSQWVMSRGVTINRILD